MNLIWIKPTSNIVERLFSRAKLILTPNRSGMSPLNFEQDIFLMVNNTLWDAHMVNDIVAKNDK